MNLSRTLALLAAGAACALATAPVQAHDHHGFYGPRFSFGLNLGYPLYSSPYYYGNPYYYPAPPAVVYTTPPSVVVAAPPPSQVVYQYFCPASNDYYPHVPTCVQPWLRVVPDGTATY